MINKGRYKTVHVNPPIGTKFTNWVVIGETNRAENSNNRLCPCRCICGKERLVLVSSLNRKTSKGCGCENPGRRLRPFEAIFRVICRQAKSRGYLVDMSYEEFIEFTNQLECHYCKSPITWATHNIIKEKSCRHNLDRKDNTKGYSLGNCVVCCARCNWSKGSVFTYEQWVEIGKLIQTWEK